MNIGLIEGKENDLDNYTSKHATVIGNINNLSVEQKDIQLDHFIVIALVKYNGHVTGDLFNSSFNTSNSLIYNGFYVKTDMDENNFNVSNSNGIVKGVTSANELVDPTLYDSFENFIDYYWQINTIDDIDRIPILFGVLSNNNDFEYTKISDIEIKRGETVSLLDYITPKTDAIRIDYQINEEETLIKIHDIYENNNEYRSDIMIEGLKKGITKLKVTSNYDGYDNEIKIKVVENPNIKFISFDSNGGTGTMNDLELNINTTSKLSKNTFSRDDYEFIGWNTSPDGSGTSYANEETITVSKDIILYAQWEKKFNYTITNYEVDEINKYIDSIEINTTIDEFKENIILNTSYSIDIETKKINEKNILYTGSKTRIYNDNNLVIEYTYYKRRRKW